jgi:hypothetical protein
MAYGAGPFVALSMIAGEDLSDEQFKFVKLSASNTVVRCTAATDLPIGVLQNKPVSGGTANVILAGISRIYAGTGGLGTVGTAVGTEADSGAPGNVNGGRAVVKSTDKDIAPGIVIMTATNADELATITLNCLSKNAMSI